MKIFYGIISNYIDVTKICYDILQSNNIITIPNCEARRSYYFTDPIYGTLKYIFIIDTDNNVVEYDNSFEIQINVLTKEITLTVNNNEKKQKEISSKLIIKHGSFGEELPEQLMTIKFLTGNEKVLEIGGNIGRNSLIIGSILADCNNFVSLECDTESANKLCENRNLNNMNFHIENAALSKRQLIQRGWDTIVSDTILDGYKKVNTITLEELNKKYNIVFDTLILDCEGAFYYILIDMPEILNNINLIIMENDYYEINKKTYIDDILKQNNFYVAYSEAGGWGPCSNNFYETWKRNLTPVDAPIVINI